MVFQEDKVLLFIPVYNDFFVITDIVREVRALMPAVRILIVDDGSHCHFDPTIIEKDAYFVRLPDNFGIGVCTHIAFDFALAFDFEIVVRIDADGQHPIERLLDFVDQIRFGQADIVVGNRVFTADIPEYNQFARRLLKKYFSIIASLITRGCSPQDVNSGMLAFNRHAITILNKSFLERYPEPQIIITACRKGLSLRVLDVTCKERVAGKTSIGLLHALRIFYRFHMFILVTILGKNSEG